MSSSNERPLSRWSESNFGSSSGGGLSRWSSASREIAQHERRNVVAVNKAISDAKRRHLMQQLREAEATGIISSAARVMREIDYQAGNDDGMHEVLRKFGLLFMSIEGQNYDRAHNPVWRGL